MQKKNLQVEKKIIIHKLSFTFLCSIGNALSPVICMSTGDYHSQSKAAAVTSEKTSLLEAENLKGSCHP